MLPNWIAHVGQVRKDFRCRSSRHGRQCARSPAGIAGFLKPACSRQIETRPQRCVCGGEVFCRRKASGRCSRRGKSRRHQGEQRLSGRVSASKICRSKTTSFVRPTRTAHASFSFLEARVFIRSSRRSRFPKQRCWTDRWNQPTKLTQLRRLPGSSFARRTLANMVRISFR